jgi:hypothetical protein
MLVEGCPQEMDVAPAADDGLAEGLQSTAIASIGSNE